MLTYGYFLCFVKHRKKTEKEHWWIFRFKMYFYKKFLCRNVIVHFPLSVQIDVFTETQVLKEERGCVPYVPKFTGECVLMSYNSRRTRERELQIGHVNAAFVDVARVYKAVSGIVDAAGAQDVQSGDEHSASAAARIVDGDNAVVCRLVLYKRFIHDGARHKFRDMVGRKELPGVFAAEIAFHKQLAEVVVESAVIIDNGGKQGVNFAENLREFPLQVGRIALDDLHIAFLAFLFLCEIDLIGNCDGAAFEQIRNEFVFIHLIGGTFYVLHNVVEFRDKVRAEVLLLFGQKTKCRYFLRDFGQSHVRRFICKVKKERRRHNHTSSDCTTAYETSLNRQPSLSIYFCACFAEENFSAWASLWQKCEVLRNCFPYMMV